MAVLISGAVSPPIESLKLFRALYTGVDSNGKTIRAFWKTWQVDNGSNPTL